MILVNCIGAFMVEGASTREEAVAMVQEVFKATPFTDFEMRTRGITVSNPKFLALHGLQLTSPLKEPLE